MRLCNITTDDNIPTIPHEGKTIRAKVVEVYDGDTCTIVYKFHRELLRTSVRIEGIDTPELVVKNKDDMNPDDLKLALLQEKAGEIVRDYVRSLILQTVVRVHVIEPDKYGGRIIGCVFTPEREPLNEKLLERGYAKPYEGKKKEKWTEEELMHIINSLQ